MKTSEPTLKTTPEGIVHRASKAALMVCAAIAAAGCAAPPKAAGPSAFDQELAKSVQQVAKVTSSLRENQGNPPLKHYDGFPLPKTVHVGPAEHDSKIAMPPAAHAPKPEVASPVVYPKDLNTPVTLAVKNMPVNDLMNLLASKIHWTYAYTGVTSNLTVTLQDNAEPVNKVFGEISRQLSNRAVLKLDAQSHMILLKAGA